MDARVTELHCIMPIANIHSIMVHGILSYEHAAKLTHQSVAMQPVQELRDEKSVPRGLKLHKYANLYFHARNPMMFKRKHEAAGLCILRVSVEVFRIPGTVITDCNAASDYARYFAPSQWSLLNFDDIYAMDWRHPNDRARYLQHRSRKCAEVLVPQRVGTRFLTGAYVVDAGAGSRLVGVGFGLPITVNPLLFFH